MIAPDCGDDAYGFTPGVEDMQVVCGCIWAATGVAAQAVTVKIAPVHEQIKSLLTNEIRKTMTLLPPANTFSNTPGQVRFSKRQFLVYNQIQNALTPGFFTPAACPSSTSRLS